MSSAGCRAPSAARRRVRRAAGACILATGPVLDVDLLPRAIAAQAAAEPAPAEAPRFAALTAEALDAAQEAAIADVERAPLAWPETCNGHGSRSRGGYASGTCMRDVVPRAAPHDVT
jgi:Nif-specific regulatory protein/two-component system response regulator HydG